MWRRDCRAGIRELALDGLVRIEGDLGRSDRIASRWRSGGYGLSDFLMNFDNKLGRGRRVAVACALFLVAALPIHAGLPGLPGLHRHHKEPAQKGPAMVVAAN